MSEPLLKRRERALKEHKPSMTVSLEPEVWIRRSRGIPIPAKEGLAAHARLRLFCFPFAGGGASVYHAWPEELPSGVDVCPVQLPGRENRLAETPYTQLTVLVETLAQVLRPYMNIPFAILVNEDYRGYAEQRTFSA